LHTDTSIKIKIDGKLSQISVQSVEYKKRGPYGYVNLPEDERNRGKLHMEMDDAFVNDVLYEIADVMVQRSAYFEEEIRGDKSEALHNFIREIVAPRIIVKMPNGYATTITWKHGDIQTNGVPLRLWNLVKLLAVRELIVNPKLTARIEAIESRGGLDQAQVKTAIKSSAKSLVDCVWQKRPKAPALLRETIKVAWQIDKKGGARVTDITFSTQENAATKSCLQNILENKIGFPRSSEPSSVSLAIRYQITLK
jgi:hypothetical protein